MSTSPELRHDKMTWKHWGFMVAGIVVSFGSYFIAIIFPIVLFILISLSLLVMPKMIKYYALCFLMGGGLLIIALWRVGGYSGTL